MPQVQLNVSHTKLAELRPADIADILEQLDVEEAGAMLDRLDTETAAEAFNEVESPLQYEILSELDPERASDLLEALAPDDAADILADLPAHEAERLLSPDACQRGAAHSRPAALWSGDGGRHHDDRGIVAVAGVDARGGAGSTCASTPNTWR